MRRDTKVKQRGKRSKNIKEEDEISSTQDRYIEN